MTRNTLKKTAFDLSHVSSVRAFALLHNGAHAGRIVANYSDNPNGSVCTATVHFFAGPLRGAPSCTGNAGGGGYDKLSAAIDDALSRGCVEHPHFGGSGMSEVEKWLKTQGYETLTVI